MQKTSPAPTRSVPEPALHRLRNTKPSPPQTPQKKRAAAAVAKKHKAETAAKRHDDAVAVQQV
jgi:hypothetical protein